MSSLELIIMTGGEDSTPEDRLMAEAWRASTLDWVEKGRRVPLIGRILAVTNSPAFAERLRAFDTGVEISVDDSAFQFGRRLRGIITDRHLRKPFYAGGGSGVLLTLDDIQALAQAILDGENLLITNNFYSADFVAFTPGDAILRIAPPDTDNDLAWRLGRQAELRSLALPPSASALFDLDTPVDLMIAAAHPGTPPRIKAYLDGLTLDCAPLRRAMEVLRKPSVTVAIAGRIGAAARAHLEEQLGCTVILFAEERGMRASGRAARGEARTVLGHFLGERGPDELFRVVADTADVLLMDSRVLFSHWGKWPSNADRFRSDMLQAEGIADPRLRQLTEAAARAPIPVLLGGHSLVSGGLYAMVEIVRLTSPQ
jgi:hypothetical protein